MVSRLRTASARVTLPAVGLLVAACPPNLNDTVSIVTSARVLAVHAEPAEADPTKTMPPIPVTFTALVAGPNGDVSNAHVEWAFCNAPKPLAQLGPVNPVCLEPAAGANFSPLGSGLQVTGTLPVVGCREFGPSVPQAMMGQPPGRPVDPDSTGGYYQPVQVVTTSPDGDSLTVFRSRLSCGLASATGDEQATYGQRYHINVNPQVAALSVSGGAPLAEHSGGAMNAVKAGQKLNLTVSWAQCPLTDVCGDNVCGPDESAMSCPADCTNPKGCTGAERYLNLDLTSETLVDQREGISVAWFATAGSFDSDATGRASTDTANTSDNGWQPPAAQQAPVVMWVVLHDDRGGVGWGEYAFSIE
jgi:hypothetical protein